MDVRELTFLTSLSWTGQCAYFCVVSLKRPFSLSFMVLLMRWCMAAEQIPIWQCPISLPCLTGHAWIGRCSLPNESLPAYGCCVQIPLEQPTNRNHSKRARLPHTPVRYVGGRDFIYQLIMYEAGNGHLFYQARGALKYFLKKLSGSHLT